MTSARSAHRLVSQTIPTKRSTYNTYCICLLCSLGYPFAQFNLLRVCMGLARKNFTLYSTEFYTLSLRLYSMRRSLRILKDFIRMIYPRVLNTMIMAFWPTRIIQLVSLKKYIFYSKLALIRLQARGESSPWPWSSTAFCFYSVK
jgi:hypothetical protein